MICAPWTAHGKRRELAAADQPFATARQSAQSQNCRSGQNVTKKYFIRKYQVFRLYIRFRYDASNCVARFAMRKFSSLEQNLTDLNREGIPIELKF